MVYTEESRRSEKNLCGFLKMSGGGVPELIIDFLRKKNNKETR